MQAKALSMKDVSVVRNGVRILDRVTVDIDVGENVAIIGLNGSGKTTLLKLFRGDAYPYDDDEHPYSMEIFGEERWNIFELRRKMGVVSMDLQSLFDPKTTAREVVGSGFFGSLDIFRGMELDPAMGEHILYRAKEMGIEDLLDRDLEGLSLGEMRRALIARALVTNPKMLVLDEPMTGLDIVMKSKFRKMFDVLAETGVNIVMITHELADIPVSTKRVVMIKRGRIFADGKKEDLLNSGIVSELYGADIKVESNKGIYRMHLERGRDEIHLRRMRARAGTGGGLLLPVRRNEGRCRSSWRRGRPQRMRILRGGEPALRGALREMRGEAPACAEDGVPGASRVHLARDAGPRPGRCAGLREPLRAGPPGPRQIPPRADVHGDLCRHPLHTPGRPRPTRRRHRGDRGRGIRHAHAPIVRGAGDHSLGRLQAQEGGEPTAEDWTEKHRPKTLGGIVGNPGAAAQIRQWAGSWERGIPEKRALVLIGSPGVGKTSAAEALANEMGWGIVEMNASDQRTGKAIEDVALRASYFNTFGDDGSFLSAKNGGRKLIVLDEADSLYGNADRGAMPAINNLIKTTKQPVILICNDFYELSRKSSTVKTGTIQIIFRRPTSASIAKVLRNIARSEGAEVDEDALAKIALNANGDLRAAVRDLESLCLGEDRVTAKDAAMLSGRAVRKSNFDLIDAIFRKRDPVLAQKTMLDCDSDPEEISVWIDENVPYECHDPGDLMRCTGRLARADVYLGRVRRTRQFGMWPYANQMMTLGMIDSLKSPLITHDRIRFPQYLLRMSRSRSVRGVRRSLALKIGSATHTSEAAVYSEILPCLSIMAQEDEELRMVLVRDYGLEPEELGFLIGKKMDSKAVKKAFEDAFPPAGEEPKKPKRRTEAAEPKPAAIPESPKREPEAEPAPGKNQRNLFDFRGERMGMEEGYRERLVKQHYRIYNDHAAVKLCGWMKQTMLHGRHCYKQDFYGIETHRCLQMTPAINQCTHMCPFCWRIEGCDFDVREWAEPKEMLDALIGYQRKLLSGFKGDPRCSEKMWEEAWNPNQVAISLAGEPTEYPYLSDFIKECRSRGMTAFLVTNGTLPERIEALDTLPNMLYVTVAAPDEKTYKRACAPKIPDGWGRIMRTLEMLPSLETRTVVRHTLVQNVNLLDPDAYARIDRAAQPDFVEPKGYVFVGGSRQRLTVDEMPSHETIRGFSQRLADGLGLAILNEKEDSRVVLIGPEGTECDVRKAWEGGRPRSPRLDALAAGGK